MAEIRFLCDCGSKLRMQNEDEEKLAGTEICGKCGRVYAVAATMSVIDRGR